VSQLYLYIFSLVSSMLLCMRTSYEDLRDLVAGCMLPPRGNGDDAGARKSAPSPINPRLTAGGNNLTAKDNDFTIDSNSLVLAGGMFGVCSRHVRAVQKGPQRRHGAGAAAGAWQEGPLQANNINPEALCNNSSTEAPRLW